MSAETNEVAEELATHLRDTKGHVGALRISDVSVSGSVITITLPPLDFMPTPVATTRTITVT